MNTTPILARSIVSAALCTVLSTSCGQRGALYLPGEERTQVQQPAPPAPTPAPTSTPSPESPDTPPDAGADSGSETDEASQSDSGGDADPDADKDPDSRESSVPPGDVAE